MKCKEMGLPITKKNLFILSQRFSVFYNMCRSTWPSSGNTRVYGIHGRKLST